jgi:hypothetical protein
MDYEHVAVRPRGAGRDPSLSRVSPVITTTRVCDPSPSPSLTPAVSRPGTFSLQARECLSAATSSLYERILGIEEAVKKLWR